MVFSKISVIPYLKPRVLIANGQDKKSKSNSRRAGHIGLLSALTFIITSFYQLFRLISLFDLF